MKVLVVEPGKKPCAQEIDSGLRSMQEVVGGYIQAVYPFEDDVAIVCNEEGKLMGLPPNRPLYDEDGRVYDILVGTFFVCACPPEAESFQSLTEEQIEKYAKIFR